MITAFDFIKTPELISKPRQKMLTALIDKGLNLAETENLLTTARDYIDIVKLGFGTAKLYPMDQLKKKINLLKEHGIIVYPGGTFFEIAYLQNTVTQYIHQCQELGFNAIEISDGVRAIPLIERLKWIEVAKENNFTVLLEVGRKEAEEDAAMDIATRIVEAQQAIAAGAWKVILEARETGNVGLFDQAGQIKVDEVQTLINAVDANHVIFEAPQKHQQVWFIKNIGYDVNLGNINSNDIYSLTSLRLGLRADTTLQINQIHNENSNRI